MVRLRAASVARTAASIGVAPSAAPRRWVRVSGSVTDPITRTHRRGAAEGATPIEGAVRATLAALNRTISREL